MLDFGGWLGGGERGKGRECRVAHSATGNKLGKIKVTRKTIEADIIIESTRGIDDQIKCPTVSTISFIQECQVIQND
jgi:hypothetical protein